MAYKIALSAGHGKNTPGKRCMKKLDPKQTREWVLNDRIADKVEKKLKSYTGYQLLRLDDTTGKKDISLRARTNAANNFDADIYIALHHNAGIAGGKGGGIVAIVYNKTTNAESIAWQKELYKELIAATGLKGNRATPLAKQNLHEVRESKMAAVLLELGFMDSATDVPIILTEKYADQCATAIVKVIVKRGKLKKKAIEQPKPVEPKPVEPKPVEPKPVETKPATSDALYRVFDKDGKQVGAYSTEANAFDKVKDQLKAGGKATITLGKK